MTTYETIDVIIEAASYLVALSMFVIALLTFLDQRKKK